MTTKAMLNQLLDRISSSAIMKSLSHWFLGELPVDYPKEQLRPHQGFTGVREQLKDEDKRQKMADGRKRMAYPSGLIVRWIRLAIVLLNYARIQVWIDHARDWMAFTVLKRERRTLEEIATWRDHYYLMRFGYFVTCLLVLPYIPPDLRAPLYLLSVLLIVDMLGGLAGSALIWYKKSVSFERTFLISLMNYVEIIIAFAGLYRVCGCLNVSNPDVLQALYFSTVAATTVGFGDIVPLNSAARDPCGCPAPVSHLGLFLVIAQLGLFVLFVLVFVNVFLSRSFKSD